MNSCKNCRSELIEDLFGLFCPNEGCESINGGEIISGSFTRFSIPLIKKIYPALLKDIFNVQPLSFNVNVCFPLKLMDETNEL